MPVPTSRLVVRNEWGNIRKVCRKGSAINCEFLNLVRLTNSYPVCHHNQSFFLMVWVSTGNPPTSWIIPLSINCLSNASSPEEHNFVPGALPPPLRRPPSGDLICLWFELPPHTYNFSTHIAMKSSCSHMKTQVNDLLFAVRNCVLKFCASRTCSYLVLHIANRMHL